LKIWIDADACPREVKEIVYRASERLGLEVRLVANQDMFIPRTPLISLVRVPPGFDAADRHIAQESSPEDIVVTADIPLAAEVVRKGSVAIDPRGEVYTEENVGERLSVRNFMQEMRSGGLIQGGPAKLGPTDHHRFASALDRELTKRRKEQG